MAVPSEQQADVLSRFVNDQDLLLPMNMIKAGFIPQSVTDGAGLR